MWKLQKSPGCSPGRCGPYATVALALALIATAVGAASGQADEAKAPRANVERLVAAGKYDDAEAAGKRWLQAAEQRTGDQSLETAEALDGLVRVLAGMKRYDDAEALWRRALDIRVRAVGPKHALITKAIDLMVGLYIDQGRTKDAEALWRDGLDAFKRQPPPEALRGLENPANAVLLQVPDLIAQGRFKDAEVQLRRQGDETALAAFLLDRGRVDEGLSLHQKLLKAGPAASRAVNFAALYRQRALAPQEQDFLRMAVAIQEQTLGHDHPEIAATLTALATSCERAGDLENAYDAARRVTIVMSGNRGRRALTGFSNTVATLREPYLEFLRIAARLAQRRKESQERISHETFEAAQWASETVAGISLSQMAVRLAKGSGPLAELVRQRQDLEREWLRQDGVLQVALAAVGPANDAREKQIVRREIATLEERMGRLDEKLRNDFPEYFRLFGAQPLKAQEAMALLKAKEVVVQFVVLGTRAYVWLVTSSNVMWREIPRSVSEIEAAVATLRCGLDAEEWEGIERGSRCGTLLGVPKPSDSDPLPFHFGKAHELYRDLLGPFEDMVRDKHLLIVPSGPLTSLPFHVLLSEPPKVAIGRRYEEYSDVAWLARRQAITMLPSVSSLRALRADAKRSPARKDYIGWGNPGLKGDGSCRRGIEAPASCAPVKVASSATQRPARMRSVARSASLDRLFRKGAAQETLLAEVRALCPLPDTAFEIRCVAENFATERTEIYLGVDATEVGIKALSQTGALADYRIVHFATHGLLAGDMEAVARHQREPALVMTPPEASKDADDDGLLTASEVAQLRLNADWVILSACNTAAGDKLGAEALSGLASAFFYAGARALLVSHWPVYSDAAVVLVNRAFAETRDASVGRAEALRRAMVALIDDPGRTDNAHPSVWAPFVLVGEGAR